MTVICGIHNRTESSIHIQQIVTMLSAYAHYNPDHCDCDIQGRSGFARLPSHYILKQTVVPPSSVSSDRLRIVADADIYNRHELFNKLAIYPQQVNWTNQQLILAAYQKWGKECPTHLIGDFAFVIWDKNKREIIACRDPLGNRPLLYYLDSKRFIFASEAKAILALPEIDKQLNKQHLASFVSSTAKDIDKENTLFSGIKSVEPATLLTVSDKGCQKHAYWKPDIHRRLSYKNDDEVLEAFQSLLFEAVTCRLDEGVPTAALLSGGLDSSGIVSVASSHLSKQGKPLITLSSVKADNDKSIVDEREYIDAFKHDANLQMHYISAPDSGPFDRLEDLIQRVESPLVMSRHYVFHALFEEARRQGVNVILDGVNGELGASLHANAYFPELFLQGKWGKLYQHINVRSQLMQRPSWRILASQVVRPLITLPKNSGRKKWQQLLQREFVEQHLNPAFRKEQPVKFKTRYSHRYNQYQALLSAQHTSSVVDFTGHPTIQRRYPLADIRLLEFCLAAPGNLKVRDGYNRYLIRGGLEGIIPPKIQWRTSKEPFSPDYHKRYNRQKNIAMNIIKSIKPNDPLREIVNIDHLTGLVQNDMTNNRGSAPVNQSGLHLIPKGVYLITFLRQFPEFQT